MVTRVKKFADYRKQLALDTTLEAILDYEPKHLISKTEIKDQKLEKKIKILNEYEQKRNVFQKYYRKKQIIYYSCITLVSLCLLALLVYLGLRFF